MTAVHLFDVLARDDGVRADPRRWEQAAHLAQKLVGFALADWQRVLDYEEDFSSEDYSAPALDDAVNHLLLGMYEKWAREAGEVLERIRRLRAAGHSVERADELEDAYLSASTRLKLTPEMVARATEQVRQGQAIPIEELRDELRARIRP